ncbi:acyltransferase domain-containing protein, partial [Lacticaseibacillus paracasei]
QPSLFATSCALTTLWKEWGILPHVVLGHSTGEYAAAYCAGVFSLEDGFKLITKRAELIETYAPPGNMASVISRRLDAE